MPVKNAIELRLAEGGRIVIPAWARQQLGLKIGDALMLTIEGDHAAIIPARAARRRSQSIVRKYLKGDDSLSSELLAERKAEAGNE